MNRTATNEKEKRVYTPEELEALKRRVALTPEEFAALFGKSRTWTYRRLYAGDIKAIQGMGAIMIPVSEVARLEKVATVLSKSTRRKRARNAASAK